MKNETKETYLEKIANRTITSGEVLDLCKILDKDLEAERDSGMYTLILLGCATLCVYLDKKERTLLFQ